MSIELFSLKSETISKIPFYSVSVSAGIPIPIDTDEKKVIDLNEYLVGNPNSTFFAKIYGDDLENIGISDGDILIIDTEVETMDSKMILVMLNGELTVKFFRNINGKLFLESNKGNYVSLNIPGLEYEYIGTITKIIHSI